MKRKSIAIDEFDIADDYKMENRDKLELESRYLKKFQIIHAYAILLVPIPFTIYAIYHAAVHGITWWEISLFVIMYCVSWIGITVGFHRFYSHKSFKGGKATKIMLGIFGSMACQGPLNYWVSNHRRHHQYSDQPGDVHSPYVDKDAKSISGWFRSFWHSHVAWTYSHEITKT
ncbi:MAG: fatty acid desaturase, partial [Bacteroidota bacterium]